ncbi:MAG: hypothetical protein HKO85_01680, partial [Xanthomonadales bacterium]|nr:hypothetical protein [Gammaproteobacteria bacterium]NNL03969.1 hypothetical protein [Xanthomonadales bacterium]
MKIINGCIPRLFVVAIFLFSGAALAQEEANYDDETAVNEQDDVSKALDSTATQWSFQFAWQQTDWKTDMVGGQPRPQGLDNFAQLRIVAPFVFEKFT